MAPANEGKPVNSGSREMQSLEDFYPSFFEAEPPKGSLASKCWCGMFQPFADGDAARILLRHLDRDQPVAISQGTLSVTTDANFPTHPMEPMLIDMTVQFSVLILGYDNGQHPRAFCMTPRISSAVFPGHPHLRLDQTIEHHGHELTALCIYSAAEFKYAAGLPKIVQYLDQTAIFLAKHLIWIRTRRLYEAATGRQLYALPAGQLIIDAEPPVAKYVFGASREFKTPPRIWQGFWPGTTAASGARAHTETINRVAECWCGSGELYGVCHRPLEAASLRNI